MSGGGVARRLLGLMRPFAPLVALSAACRVVNQSLGVAIPALAAAAVARIGTGSAVGGIVAGLAVLAVVKGLFRYLEQFTGHAVAFRLLAALRADAYRWMEPLAPAGLEDERAGDLVDRVVGDVDRIEPFYAHTVAPVVSAVLVPLVVSAGLALWVDPIVALAFVPFPVAIVGVVPWVARHRVAVLSADARAQSGEAAAALTDAVQGAREVAVFRARQQVLDGIVARSEREAATERRLARIGAVRTALGDLLSAAAVVTVAAIGAARLGDGLMGLPGMVSAITVAWAGTGPARALEDVVPDLERALAAAGRLFEIADRRPPIAPPAGLASKPVDGSVSIEGVSLHRAGASAPVLDRVDASIAGGSHVAIVGPSGSGKSTLVELLVRFRDPDDGRVIVGGSNVREVGLSRLRSHVALVPQRAELFFGTIADNLRLADPEADSAAMWEALERAELGSWARSLPNGLETQVGEMGTSVSGGQRQRLAIARVHLRHPSVVILDEATSELDAATEARVVDAILRDRGGRTVIVVAHRLSTVAGADDILVMDGGRIVEHGRHAQLVESDATYAGLWRRHRDLIVSPASERAR